MRMEKLGIMISRKIFHKPNVELIYRMWKITAYHFGVKVTNIRMKILLTAWKHYFYTMPTLMNPYKENSFIAKGSYEYSVLVWWQKPVIYSTYSNLVSISILWPQVNVYMYLNFGLYKNDLSLSYLSLR